MPTGGVLLMDRRFYGWRKHASQSGRCADAGFAPETRKKNPTTYASVAYSARRTRECYHSGLPIGDRPMRPTLTRRSRAASLIGGLCLAALPAFALQAQNVQQPTSKTPTGSPQANPGQSPSAGGQKPQAQPPSTKGQVPGKQVPPGKEPNPGGKPLPNDP